MMRTAFATFAACLAAAGCGPKPAPPELKIQLTAPAADAVAPATGVHLQFTVSGGPDKVELVAGGQVAAALDPPYGYQFAPQGSGDATYQVKGRATRGAEVVESEARQITVDRTLPAVIAMTPSASDVLVDRNAPWKIDFSEPVQPDFLSVITATVDGASVPVTAQLSASRTSVTVTPAAAPAPPAQVDISLPSGILDDAGNQIAGVPAWSFFIPAWRSLAGAIPLDATYSSSPQAPVLRLDAAGRPVVALAASSSGGADTALLVRRLDVLGWSKLGDSVGSGVAAYDMAVGPNYRPVVTWTSASGGSWTLSARRWNGTGWDAFPDVANLAAPDHALALDASGTIWVALADGSTAPGTLHVLRWNGAAFEQVGSSLGTDPRRPALEIDPNGAPVVGFEEPGSSSSFAARWNGGTSSWGQLGGGVAGAANQGGTALAIASASQIWFAWDAGAGPFYLHLQESDGSSWVGSSASIGAYSALGAVSFTFDPSGAPTVFFSGTVGTAATALSRTKLGAVWSPAFATPVSDAHPLIAVSRHALAYASGKAELTGVTADAASLGIHIWVPNGP